MNWKFIRRLGEMAKRLRAANDPPEICVTGWASGRWTDIFRDPQGNILDIRHGRNRVAINYGPLVAGLLANDSTVITAAGPSNFTGIQYFALGEGLLAWDTSPVDPTFSETQLTAENFRMEMWNANASFDFLDASLNVVAVPPLVERIRVSIVLDTSTGNGLSFREMGLFGGTATATANTGYMLNKAHFTRIDKTASFSLDRAFTIDVAKSV